MKTYPEESGPKAKQVEKTGEPYRRERGKYRGGKTHSFSECKKKLRIQNCRKQTKIAKGLANAEKHSCEEGVQERGEGGSGHKGGKKAKESLDQVMATRSKRGGNRSRETETS